MTCPLVVTVGRGSAGSVFLTGCLIASPALELPDMISSPITLRSNNTARKEGVRKFLNRISFAQLRKKLAKRSVINEASISQIQGVDDAHPQRDILP